MLSIEKMNEIIRNELSPEERARLQADQAWVAESALGYLKNDAPQYLDQVLATLEPEQRLAGLEPEQRLAGLEPEQRQKLLKLLLEQNLKTK